MDIAKAAEYLLLMLLPTLVVTVVLHFGQAVRAGRRLLEGQRGDRDLQRPTSPPIEQLAADLRRLLVRHEAVLHATDLPMRAHRLRAVEGAIADCATGAAAALGVRCPERPGRRPLPQREIRQLLLALAQAGLVLPPAIGLLASDS